MFLEHFGPFHYVKSWNINKFHLISDWKRYEVWEAVWTNEIPYCKKYDTGSTRIGCITCTAFKSWENVMLREYPRLYDVICKRYKLKYSPQLDKFFEEE